MASNKSLTGTLIILTLICSVPPPVMAYTDEVHYALNYYLARLTGYSPEQAFRLASLCTSVDRAPNTEPVQARKLLGRTHTAQYVRVKFHAFMNQQLHPQCLKNTVQGLIDKQLAKAEIKLREDQLYQTAHDADLLNVGVMIHFLQDETSHDGYGSFGGHWASRGTAEAYHSQYPGFATDYLAEHDISVHVLMIKNSLAHMRKFLKDNCPCQLQRNVDWDKDVEPILERLRQVNPVNRYGIKLTRPDLEKACTVVESFLKQHGDQAPFPHHPYSFILDENGKPDGTDMFNKCVLWGGLQVNLHDDTGNHCKNFRLSISNIPTFGKADPKVQLAEATAGNVQTITFQALPVGQVILQINGPGGWKFEQPVQIESSLNTLDLDYNDMIQSAAAPSTN